MVLRAAAVVALAFCLTACAGRKVPELGALGIPRATLSIDSEELLRPDRLSPELRQWLGSQQLGDGPTDAVLGKLVRLLQGKRGLGLRYVAGDTGTAHEVFISREFNCLSFSYLLVALARELGMPAYYMRVDQVLRYERDGDLIVGTNHATVGLGDGKFQWVLEYNVGPTLDYRLAKPMTDTEAIALYYLNKGAEQLRVGAVEKALAWLEPAVGLAPQLADAWLNLGVALRRSGDLDGAERAYRFAIGLEPDLASAYHNLALLLRLRGEEEAAGEMLRVLDAQRPRNPYVYLTLGDQSFREGELAQAERFYRRALRLSDLPAEARAALGLLAVSIGDVSAAERWLSKARKADPKDDRVRQLEAALADVVG